MEKEKKSNLREILRKKKQLQIEIVKENQSLYF